MCNYKNLLKICYFSKQYSIFIESVKIQMIIKFFQPIQFAEVQKICFRILVDSMHLLCFL
jgi:hypothetical protein